MKLSTFLIGAVILQILATTTHLIYPSIEPITDIPLVILVCTVCIVLTLEQNRKVIDEKV
tara:strand:- start:87 stop:266 length:180 start_codon:yes stop_codon:yes gene_type:complete